MPRLTATYELTLSRRVRIQRASADAFSYRATVDAFDVVLTLIPDDAPVATPAAGLPIRYVQRINIAASREEIDGPPAIATTGTGEHDFAPRVQWIAQRSGAYRAISLAVANRFIQFSKYVLRTPHLLGFRDSDFDDPAWSDAAGAAIESGVVNFAFEIIRPTGPHLLGERELSVAHDTAIAATLALDREVTTPQEFLSDAQSSTLNGNVRRAVLELAIACEVAIKHTFFARGTPAAAAAEYLAENRPIKVIDLIDQPALEAFAESFKVANAADEEKVDYLFRARNKVAHRGTAVFRDRRGNPQTVDRAMLESWMQSVIVLFQWLETKTGRPT